MTRKIANKAVSAASTPAPTEPVQETPGPAKRVRKPFGQHRAKLDYPARPGFRRYWFIDRPGRVDMAKDAGYEHVRDADGKNVCRPTGVNDDGGPQISYLMEIPEALFQEDMAAQQKIVDEIDSAIYRGAVGGEPGKDGRYVKLVSIQTR